MSWNDYIAWSRLYQLSELVSLDNMLNKPLVEPDYENPDDWSYIHTYGEYTTGFFTNPEYVLGKLKNITVFNFIQASIEPEQDCSLIPSSEYQFIGYELLDKSFDISALSNCGGFDETFLPTELNQYGLISNYTQAYDIKKRLLKNNPNEFHADTHVIAVWRHKTLGQPYVE